MIVSKNKKVKKIYKGDHSIEMVTRGTRIIYYGEIYIEGTWAEVKAKLLALPKNTINTPYTIKVTDLTDDDTYDFCLCFMNDLTQPYTSYSLSRYCNIIAEGTYTKFISRTDYNIPYITNLTLREGCTTINKIRLQNCDTLTLPSTFTLSANVFDGWTSDCPKHFDLSALTDVTTLPKYCFNNSNVYKVTLAPTMTEIGENAFYGCSKLEDIDLTNVETLGYAAFRGTGLKTFYWKKTYTAGAILQQSAVEEITFEDGLTKIGNYALTNCANLKSLILPDSVTTIGNQLCYNCTSLETVYLPEGLTVVPNRSFQNTAIKSITIPRSITSLGVYVWADNPYLETVVFKANVANTGSYQFQNCTSLSSFTFDTPSGKPTTIGQNCFQNCTSLKTIELPDSITTIYAEAFRESGLTEVTIPANFSSWGNATNPYTFCDCKDLETVTFLGNLPTKIPPYCFYGCSKLSSINIPTSVTVVDQYSFTGTSSLENITFPEGLISIGIFAFRESGLKSVITPSTCTGINYGSFLRCENLERFEILAPNIRYPGGNFLGETPKLTLSNVILHRNIGNGLYAVGNFIGTNTNCSYPATFFGGDIYNVVWPTGANQLSSYFFVQATCFDERLYKLPDIITTVNHNAFNNSNIVRFQFGKNTKFPNSGGADYFFYNCTKLEEVIWSDVLMSAALGGNMFYGCSSLKEISLQEGVTSIGANFFQNCTSLETVYFPSTLKTIPATTFTNCPNLKRIVWYGTLAALQTAVDVTQLEYLKLVDTSLTNDDVATLAASGCCVFDLTACTGITDVGTIFKDNDNLKYIALPDTVTSLSEYAFYSCSNLETFIGEGITAIPNNAFQACNKLSSFTVGSLESIGDDAFIGCFELESIGDTSNILTIGVRAFMRSGIKYFNGPLVARIKQWAFLGSDIETLILTRNGGVTIEDGVFYSSDSSGTWTTDNIKTVYIKKLNSITEKMFYQCKKLESVQIDAIYETTPRVRPYAFYDCDNLTSVSLPDSIKFIDEYAFYSSHITSFPVPVTADIDTIGTYAFAYTRLNGDIVIPPTKSIYAYSFGSLFEEVNSIEFLGEYPYGVDSRWKTDSYVKKVSKYKGLYSDENALSLYFTNRDSEGTYNKSYKFNNKTLYRTGILKPQSEFDPDTKYSIDTTASALNVKNIVDTESSDYFRYPGVHWIDNLIIDGQNAEYIGNTWDLPLPYCQSVTFSNLIKELAPRLLKYTTKILAIPDNIWLPGDNWHSLFLDANATLEKVRVYQTGYNPEPYEVIHEGEYHDFTFVFTARSGRTKIEIPKWYRGDTGGLSIYRNGSLIYSSPKSGTGPNNVPEGVFIFNDTTENDVFKVVNTCDGETYFPYLNVYSGIKPIDYETYFDGVEIEYI